MTLRLLSLATILATMAAPGAEPVSGLTACQALSKPQQRNLARLAAKGGKPSPEIWTIVTREAKAPNGLKEHTVTAGTVVATRATSDLATKLTNADVIGVANLKVDSDQLAELAASYAAANAMTPAAFDYDLRKEGEDAAPLWTIISYDEAGTKLGAIVVAAKSGAVVSHEGFEKEPEQPSLTAVVAEAEAAPSPTEKAEDETSEAATTGAKPQRKRSTSSEEKRRPGTFRRVGGHLQKFFTGKNTIGR
jgi:hypothetical protein